MKAYGQSAGYAEQALNAIRVVQAFGQEETEIRNYDRHLNKARTIGLKTHIRSATALGSFTFVLFAFYSYGFYVGSWLITKQIYNENAGATYISGDILSCLIGIIFGVMSIGQITT